MKSHARAYPQFAACLLTAPSFGPLLAENPAPLFNGKDFTDWTVIVDARKPAVSNELFTVKNGQIRTYEKASTGSAQPFAGLVTKESFSRYTLALEYKWGERKFAPRDQFVRDAGIVFHMHGPDVIWPSGVECQIQEGDTGDLWAINTRVTSTVQPTIMNYAPAPGGKSVTRGDHPKGFARFHRGYCHETPGWNRVELTVDGDHAIFRVNGHVVNEAIDMKQWNPTTKSWTPLTKGRILLQAEGAEVSYRNVILTALPASPGKAD